MSLTQVPASMQESNAQYTGFKNRIINGAMMIDQRNAGASITPTTTQYSVDRFQLDLTQASKFTAQRNAGSITPPAGFTSYLGITSLSAYSLGAGDFFRIIQKVEGFSFYDLAWGTASAQTVTLSFWVRSSLTGTFGGVLRNAGGSRTYAFSYTISSANTWEQKAIVIVGDTTGTWNTDNTTAVEVNWSLGTGSTYSGTVGTWSGSNLLSATGATSVVGTNGATFYITGVQLEKGSTATSFDYRPYSTELALCQRYCPVFKASAANDIFGSQYNANASIARAVAQFQVTPRVVPTGATISASGDFYASSNVNMTGTSVVFYGASLISGSIQVTGGGGQTTGQGGLTCAANANAQVIFTGCEL
jgi:hypothetical protein